MMQDLLLLAVEQSDTVKNIQNFLAPVLLLVAGISGFYFLFKREFLQMITFFSIGVLVFSVFFAPQLVKNFAQSFGQAAGAELVEVQKEWDKSGE